jgi:hypothetical protein
MNKSAAIASCLLVILALLLGTRLILRHPAPDAPRSQKRVDLAHSGVDDRSAPLEAKKSDSLSGTPTIAEEVTSTEADTKEEPENKALLRGYVVDGRNNSVSKAWVGLFEPEGAFGKDEYSFLGLEPVTRELRHLAHPSGKAEITLRGPELDSPRTSATADELSLPGFPGMLFVDQTSTNEAGYFEFELQRASTPFYLQGVSPDDSSFAAGGPFRAGQGEIYLRLQGVGKLRGSVVDASSAEPLSGAIVIVENRVNAVRAQSNFQGLFSFEFLPIGSYELEAYHAEGYEPYRSKLSIASGPTEVSVSLTKLSDSKEGLRLFGAITDAITGQPIRGAEVSSAASYRTYSNDRGAYELRFLPGDEPYSLLFGVRAPGYGGVEKLVGGRTGSIEWNVSLQPSVSIKCQVVAEDGGPAGKAKVVLDQEGTARFYQRTGEDGFCAFADLPPDAQLKLFAFHPTLGRCWRNEISSRNHDLCVLKLERGRAMVDVTVKSVDGLPVGGAQVVLWERFPRGQGIAAKVRGLGYQVLASTRLDVGNVRTAVTNAGGKALFPDTFEGECLLEATLEAVQGNAALPSDPPRSEIALVDVVLDGSPIPCELVVRRPLTLSGNVHTPGGQAVEHVPILLLGMTDSEEWMGAQVALTNDRGNYRFKGLDGLRRWAVAVDAGDRSSWKPVRPDPDKEAKEEEFTTLTDRRNQQGDPASFHYFAEVPFRLDEPRWDILVELEAR